LEIYTVFRYKLLAKSSYDCWVGGESLLLISIVCDMNISCGGIPKLQKLAEYCGLLVDWGERKRVAPW
jgi:hypothetical protein